MFASRLIEPLEGTLKHQVVSDVFKVAFRLCLRKLMLNAATMAIAVLLLHRVGRVLWGK